MRHNSGREQLIEVFVQGPIGNREEEQEEDRRTWCSVYFDEPISQSTRYISCALVNCLKISKLFRESIFLAALLAASNRREIPINPSSAVPDV